MPVIDCLAIAGVGLIGGSAALAARRAGFCRQVLGFGRSAERLRRGLELGVLDHATTDPAELARADLLLLAVPLGSMASVMESLAPHLRGDCVITDAGSAKACVVEDMRRIYGAVPHNFVPGHPIAGTERSGVEAAFPELFDGRRVILTPLAETERGAHELVRRFWEAAGAQVVDMGVVHHDQVLAATSHLPHLLAFGLVETLSQLDDRAEIFKYAAGGFRDFSRIASSDPQMWHDIFFANREELLRVLNLFNATVGQVRAALQSGDSGAVLELCRRAKRARDNLYLE